MMNFETDLKRSLLSSGLCHLRYHLLEQSKGGDGNSRGAWKKSQTK